MRTFYKLQNLERFAPITQVSHQDAHCHAEVQETSACMEDVHIYSQIDQHLNLLQSRCSTLFLTIHGYLQSWRYFKDPGVQALVRQSLAPPLHYSTIADKFFEGLDRNAIYIGVQVRLGDKDDGKNYGLYPPSFSWKYYSEGIQLLQKVLASVSGKRQVILILAAGGLREDCIRFTEQTDADMAILRRCHGLVIGTSTFGWWAAYLSNLPGDRPRTVVLPKSALAAGFRLEDYYPPDWTILDNWGG